MNSTGSSTGVDRLLAISVTAKYFGCEDIRDERPCIKNGTDGQSV